MEVGGLAMEQTEIVGSGSDWWWRFFDHDKKVKISAFVVSELEAGEW
jgi:hypothetical protein